MRFKSGMLGACIVVIALLCTVLTGFVFNVEETDKEVLDYRQITDITGQFEYSHAPYYFDYNPSENYTGYTYRSIDFVPSATANPYRVVTTQGTTTISTIDLTSLSNSQTRANLYMAKKLWNPSYISVKGLLEEKGIDYRNYDSIRIDLFDSSTTWRPYLSNTYTHLATNWVQTGPGFPVPNNGTYDNSYYLHTSAFHSPNYMNTIRGGAVNYYTAEGFGNFIFNVNSSEDMDISNYALWLEVKNDSTVICYETKNGETSVKYSIDYSQAIIDWSNYITDPINTSIISEYGSAYRYYLYNGSVEEANYLSTWQPTHTVKLTVTENSTYAYMNVAEGVGLKDEVNATTWANTHTNGDINILFKLSNLTENYNFNISCAGAVVNVRSDNGLLYINDNNLGAWTTFIISFNAQKKIIGFQSVNSFSNFQVYTTGSLTNITGSTITGDSADSFDITRVNGSLSPRWSVTSTTVWLNTYGVTMVNPSINLRSYFPVSEQPILRLNFNSFSVIGDSITINGVTYPVTDGNLAVTVGEKTENIPIRGLNITWDSTDNTISINSGKTNINLGEPVDYTVSLGGVWYFIANAYGGYYTMEKAINWDAGQFTATFSQAVIIFLGLLFAGVLIAHKTGKIQPLDYIIVVFAGIMGLMVVA